MTPGIRTRDQLEEVVASYLDFDEFIFDVETFGDHRDDPRRNELFWISLAGPGRADAIPCGHPLGERIIYAPNDKMHRISPAGKHQERRVNPDSGREKWFDVPPPFTPAPKQLWVADVMNAIEPLLFSERRKIGSGVKFDLETVAKYYDGRIPPPPYGDTWMAARLIDENWHGHGLKEAVKKMFKFEYEKLGKKLDTIPYSEAYEYSYLDGKYTWLLWQLFVPMLKQEKVDHIFQLELDLLPVLIDMEMTGTPIDIHALKKLREEFEMEMAHLQVAINDVAGFEVNLNANRQVAQVVYDVLGHPCTVHTKTGERSTAKDVLGAFKRDKTVARMLEHSALRKLQSTFVDGLLESHIDGRIHPDFNQMGAVSGRLSCRRPNLQNQPSRSEIGRKVRSVFIASPGYVLIVADLSQIELRILADFTQDPRLLRAYREDLDLHSQTARIVFGDDFTDIQRSFAKNANFSVLYGAGPMTLVKRYGVSTKKIAVQLLDAFYTTYRKVGPWKKDVIYQAKMRYKKNVSPAYVKTVLGRKRRLPALLWVDDELRSAAERQAISVTISGSAADLFKVIMINCYKALNEADIGARMLMNIHDELVVEAPEENAEEALKIVKSAMEDVHNPFTGDPILSVPIVADAKIVERWSEK